MLSLKWEITMENGIQAILLCLHPLSNLCNGNIEIEGRNIIAKCNFSFTSFKIYVTETQSYSKDLNCPKVDLHAIQNNFTCFYRV